MTLPKGCIFFIFYLLSPQDPPPVYCCNFISVSYFSHCVTPVGSLSDLTADHKYLITVGIFLHFYVFSFLWLYSKKRLLNGLLQPMEPMKRLIAFLKCFRHCTNLKYFPQHILTIFTHSISVQKQLPSFSSLSHSFWMANWIPKERGVTKEKINW